MGVKELFLMLNNRIFNCKKGYKKNLNKIGKLRLQWAFVKKGFEKLTLFRVIPKK